MTNISSSKKAHSKNYTPEFSSENSKNPSGKIPIYYFSTRRARRGPASLSCPHTVRARGWISSARSLSLFSPEKRAFGRRGPGILCIGGTRAPRRERELCGSILSSLSVSLSLLSDATQLRLARAEPWNITVRRPPPAAELLLSRIFRPATRIQLGNIVLVFDFGWGLFLGWGVVFWGYGWLENFPSSLGRWENLLDATFRSV